MREHLPANHLVPRELEKIRAKETPAEIYRSGNEKMARLASQNRPKTPLSAKHTPRLDSLDSVAGILSLLLTQKQLQQVMRSTNQIPLALG